MMHCRLALRWLALLWVLSLVGSLLVGCSSEEDRPMESPVRLEGPVFGSFYQVTLVDPLIRRQARQLEEGVLDVLADVDAKMSTYRDDSELIAFNEAPVGQWQKVSDSLLDVLQISQSLAEKSQGAFDVTIGGVVNLWSFGPEARPEEVPDPEVLSKRLATIGPDAVEIEPDKGRARRTRDVFVDLSAVAKGYATDRLAHYLSEQGLEHYLINLGGDLKASGYSDMDAETPWRVGIEIPRDGPQAAQHVLSLSHVSVATSGDYRNYFEADGRRYSHTIDPRDGRPITHDLASVSVLSPSNAWADGWATALLVSGAERALALAETHELAVLLLVRDGEGWQSLGSSALTPYLDDKTAEQIQLSKGASNHEQ